MNTERSPSMRGRPRGIYRDPGRYDGPPCTKKRPRVADQVDQLTWFTPGDRLEQLLWMMKHNWISEVVEALALNKDIAFYFRLITGGTISAKPPKKRGRRRGS